MRPQVSVKRVYEPAEATDGTRVLIDGLWPRGISRAEWPEGSWRPDLAPSKELRDWYRHEVDRFPEFADRYRAELSDNEALPDLTRRAGPLTLVTATRDVEHSHASVLRDYLNSGGP